MHAQQHINYQNNDNEWTHKGPDETIGDGQPTAVKL